MKDIGKARFIIFLLGLFLTVSVFFIALLPVNSHELLKAQPKTTLPEGVHIPININTAHKETLCLLDGIWNTTADNIITYREEHGGFKTIEEIKNVRRIGENTFEKIKNYICVD
ncbi:MAG: helix-hairpin-helix domain-containing protein [Clostridia bacterium]|nr:helix-hairpin-helix domain-containing protein [Clostridia bacterium]